MNILIFLHYFLHNFVEDMSKALKQRWPECMSLVPTQAPRTLPPPPPPFPMPNTHPANLPHYLKPKKKFQTKVPMKKANWAEVNPRKISANAFWAKCQEDTLASNDLFVELAKKFSQTTSEKNSAIMTKITKRCIELRDKSLQTLFQFCLLRH